MIIPTSDKQLITVAICCYNAADYVNDLIPRIDKLDCPIPYEILIIDNNSTDSTRKTVEKLSEQISVPLRYVLETSQGIPFARNRAIEECLNSTFMAFIDADEIPETLWLKSAVQGLITHIADCVGGEILVDIPEKPKWLTDSLLLFLGKVDYGKSSFRIVDKSTPVWSGNIAYRMSLFSNGLRFDPRYNRRGTGIGGGSDGIMFREILDKGYNIRYEPDMRIQHIIPMEKLKRTYFLKLHYIAGKKTGMYETEVQKPSIFGIPRYMFLQLIKKVVYSIRLFLSRHQEYLRAAMNASHQLGVMIGLFVNNRKSPAQNNAK